MDSCYLDEPTIGLDPQTRLHLWSYILTLRRQKQITMFLTTHYMDEAEYCDRIAVIDHGVIVALDTPEHLKDLVGGDVIRLVTSDNAASAQQIKMHFGVEPRQEQIECMAGHHADAGDAAAGLYHDLTRYCDRFVSGACLHVKRL